MNSLISNKNFKFNDKDFILSKNQVGSFVVVDLDNDSDAVHEIYGLASRFFQQILDTSPLSDEVAKIAKAYDINKNKVQEDLEIFLNDLMKLKIILPR